MIDFWNLFKPNFGAGGIWTHEKRHKEFKE